MSLLSKNDFISGSLAGIMQVLSGQPFDLIKVKMQTLATKTTVLNSAKNIFNTEGIMGFYKGTLSPLTGISFCVSIQFGANEFAKRIAKEYYKTSQLGVIPLGSCGAFAGFCNSFVASPVELVRIKLQAQKPGVNKFTGSFHVIQYLYSNYGLRGVYSGLIITIMREAPGYFLYFGTYEVLMQKAEKSYGLRETVPLYKISLYGALSGTAFWIGIFPIDVIKSRLQADTIKNPKYKSIGDCANQIYAELGINGFFKGLKPCLLRVPFANMATFITFEKVNGFLKRRDQKSISKKL